MLQLEDTPSLLCSPDSQGGGISFYLWLKFFSSHLILQPSHIFREKPIFKIIIKV